MRRQPHGRRGLMMTLSLCAVPTIIVLLSATTTFAQTPRPVFPVSCYLNVLIVLDRSDSVKGAFNRSREFVLTVSGELNIAPDAHRVSMIVYSGQAYRREVYDWNFAESNVAFEAAVNALRAVGGTTNTKLALEAALQLMETRNKSIPSLIMVVTDGRSGDDPKQPSLALQRLPNTWVFAAATGDPQTVDRYYQKTGAVFIASGDEKLIVYQINTKGTASRFGNNFHSCDELLVIAGDINRVILQSGRELAVDITQKLLQQAQVQCRTSSTSTTTVATTRSTTATSTTTTDPITGCEMDLVLVLDFSTTTEPVYEQYMSMAKQLVRRLRIGPRYTRVALVLFSSVGKTHSVFRLNAYDTADEIIRAIDSLSYMGGTTAAGEGIRIALEQYDERLGGRQKRGAKQIMIVFTDGWSNKGPDPETVSNTAKRQGVEIYSVGYYRTNDNQTPTSADALDVNQYTLEIIADSVAHAFSNLNFDQLIEQVRRHNLKCL